MLEAIRCNMDIKFIRSGESAKAILYYITDYITKTDLKTHVAFAALELAVKKLGEFDVNADEATVRAKRMLQKCAYMMISHQELSAQQVAAYLVGGGDCYISHRFRNLYWMTFEASVNAERPSPECYKSRSTEENQNSEQVLPECNDRDSNNDGEAEVDDNNVTGQEPDDEPDDDGQEDVHMTFSCMGDVSERSSQVTNYRFRAKELENLSVWEFTSAVDQISRSQRWNDGLGDEEDEPECLDEDISAENKPSNTHEVHPAHPEYLHKIQRTRNNPCKRFVPVPIGPAIPRRDRPELYEKYARLMLIFFKPWRTEADLRGDSASWSEAFNEFLSMGSCTNETRKVMNNMQILHECKDSKKTHYRMRKNRVPPNERTNERDPDQPSMDEIMDHIDSVEDYNSRATMESIANIADCLTELESAGLFNFLQDRDVETSDGSGQHPPLESPERIMLPNDDTLEDQWKATYEKRREDWKRKLGNVHVETLAPMINSTDGLQPLVMTNLGAGQNLPTTDSQVMQISSSVDQMLGENISVEEIVHDWTLNTEQARAFKLIALHSTERKSKPLRMYLGGPGGTGKSRVIQALMDFFRRKNQARRLRLAATTGVAAKNIGGTTLHTALCMNLAKKKSNGNKIRTELAAMWDGVDYLFIDEVSTIGCRLLVDVHEALVSATGRTDLYGGVSVIFAGDFAQLPPVLDAKLYTHLDQKKLHAETSFGQKTTFGKLLWRSVGTVVILTEQMRQSGEGNREFVSLLNRLREGMCTKDDYSLLNSRLVSTARGTSWDDWNDTPIIVSENAVKDALNMRATLAYAQRTHQSVQWFDAIDTYRGTKVTDARVREYLLTQPSGKTGQRLGKIPIALGMPVVVSQNFDVEGGLVNGSFGYLRDYRFQTDENGIRTLTSCIVEIPDFTADALPHLPPRHVAVLSDMVEMCSIVHPVSGRSCTMKRFQVPLTPGFAMTAHKAQGLTLPRVVVDLASCRGTEQPYVMVSRCQSLDGLLVLRLFPISKITCRRSQEARNEFARLDLLRSELITTYDTRHEQEHASTHVAEGNHDRLTAVEQLFSDTSFEDPSQVRKLVQQLQRDDESKCNFKLPWD